MHDASFEKRRSENVCNNLARGCLEMTVSVQDSGTTFGFSMAKRVIFHYWHPSRRVVTAASQETQKSGGDGVRQAIIVYRNVASEQQPSDRGIVFCLKRAGNKLRTQLIKVGSAARLIRQGHYGWPWR